MIRKRIGNDIQITWTLTDSEGNPYDLTGKRFAVKMNFDRLSTEIPVWATCDVNVLNFTFHGKDQPATGRYGIVLYENACGVPMVTYDVRDIIELVEHSDEEGGETPETIGIETVEIESTIGINGQGNIIETVKVNGEALEVVDKTVNVIAVQPAGVGMPTKAWAGSAAEYKALVPSDDTIYFIKEEKNNGHQDRHD